MSEAGEPVRGGGAAAVVLFLVAFGLHLIRLDHWTAFPDEVGYAETAQGLLDRGAFVHESLMFFPPLFVYLAAGLQALGVELLLSVRLVSALFGAGIVAVVYLLVAGGYGRRTALWCSTAFLALLRLKEYGRLGQPETIHVFFGFLAFAFVLRWSRAPRPRDMAAAGLCLGAALWAKEVALSYALGIGGYLVVALLFLGRRLRAPDLGALVGGLALLCVPLIALGESSGNSLLFEVSGAKAFDVNMKSLGLAASVRITVQNVLVMFGTPAPLAYALGIPLILACGALLLRGAAQGRPVAVLSLCYVLVMLAFVTWFRTKFTYYVLPAVLLAYACALCEVVDGLAGGAERRARSLFALAGLILAAILAANVARHGELYVERGDHDSFRALLVETDFGGAIAASHTPLFRYVGAREGLGTEIHELFVGPDYELNWEALRDPGTAAVVTKAYYLERLARREQWVAMRALFPVESRREDLAVLRRAPE